MSKKRLLNEFSFGFELEGTYNHEETNSRDLASKFNSMLGGEGNMHGDGSLRSDYGYSCFEYSSPVIQFTPSNIRKVIKFLDSLPSLHVKINNTCGFHTHVSYKGITKEDAVWAMASMAADESYTNFLKLGRTNLHKAPYAKPDFLKKAFKYAENNNYSGLVETIVDNEKYRSIRIHPQGTIEWRGPRTFLNVIKHSKNVAFFKKLTQFIQRINDSLDMDYSKNISKSDFIKCAKNRLSNLHFKEEKNINKINRLLEALNSRPEIINVISANSFDNMYETLRNGCTPNFSINNLVRTLKINGIKLKSISAIEFLLRTQSISSFIELINANIFKDNIELFGRHNALTKSFEFLLKNPGVNDEVLNVLVEKALTKFGHSSIKTFSYNAMFEMIKYNVNAFKVAVNKNLIEIFGYERASSLINAVINIDKYGFRNSEIYNLLMQSPNAALVESLCQVPNYNTLSNVTLDNTIASILS